MDFPVLVKIDPIVNHMDTRRINVEQPLDVAPGFGGNGDDRIRHFHRGFLYPESKVIAAGELFPLAWPERFERMDRNDERYVIVRCGQSPTTGSVPCM